MSLQEGGRARDRRGREGSAGLVLTQGQGLRSPRGENFARTFPASRGSPAAGQGPEHPRTPIRYLPHYFLVKIQMASRKCSCSVSSEQRKTNDVPGGRVTWELSKMAGRWGRGRGAGAVSPLPLRRLRGAMALTSITIVTDYVIGTHPRWKPRGPEKP